MNQHQACVNALPTGSKLNQFEIQNVLGQGGFGITYLATDSKLNQTVAIKEFLPEPLAYRDTTNTVKPNTASNHQPYSHFKQRFLEEAQILAQFKHPNIVRVQQYFEANNTAYLVMDYEQGQSLEKYVMRGAKFNMRTLLQLIDSLCQGLNILHELNIIHRDIKPANIYIRHDGSPVLLDFGSARTAIAEQTQDLTTLLTAGYAPIEQYFPGGSKQGPWTDIYAVSAVIYELISGTRPVEAIARSEAKLRQQADPHIPASELRNTLAHPLFLQLIDDGMALLSENRPQSVYDWQIQFQLVAIYQRDEIFAESNSANICTTTVDNPFFQHEASEKTQPSITEPLPVTDKQNIEKQQVNEKIDRTKLFPPPFSAKTRLYQPEQKNILSSTQQRYRHFFEHSRFVVFVAVVSAFCLGLITPFVLQQYIPNARLLFAWSLPVLVLLFSIYLYNKKLIIPIFAYRMGVAGSVTGVTVSGLRVLIE
jgi:serine/threonine protein kinase